YFCVLKTPLDKRLLFNAVYAATLDTQGQSNVTRLVDVQGAGQADQPLHILVGEDNATNQKVLRKILEFAGHKVTVVGDGEQALDALEEDDSYDLLILDMHMPEMGGIDVVKIMRFSNPRTADLPVIILTADATPDAARLCREAGIDVFLTKPVESTRLLRVVQSLTSSKARPAAEPAAAAEAPSVDDSPVIDHGALHSLSTLSNDTHFMEELIHGFIEDSRALVDRLRRAVDAQRFEEVRDYVHALKG